MVLRQDYSEKVDAEESLTRRTEETAQAASRLSARAASDIGSGGRGNAWGRWGRGDGGRSGGRGGRGRRGFGGERPEVSAVVEQCRLVKSDLAVAGLKRKAPPAGGPTVCLCVCCAVPTTGGRERLSSSLRGSRAVGGETSFLSHRIRVCSRTVLWLVSVSSGLVSGGLSCAYGGCAETLRTPASESLRDRPPASVFWCCPQSVWFVVP